MVSFSQNIAEDQIEPFIRAAQEYDLEPRLGPALLAALENIAPIPTAPDPETPAAPDPTPQLRAFLPKVKRYLVLAAYQRFIARHGFNITQFGMSKTADPQGTMEPLDPAERAIILKQNQADINTALIKLTRGAWIFEGVDYSTDNTADSKQQSTSIRAPKRKATRAPRFRFINDEINGLY